MKFGNWVFPVSPDPITDKRIINEAIEEIVLCDKVGFEVAWLSEHHFDGSTAYVDPMVFAGSVARETKNIKIGFAVLEMALHHPVRVAAQIALLDHLTDGRVILGTGKGSAFNEYEYTGFGVSMDEAANSLAEAEQIIFEAWKGGSVDFKGKYWNLSFPSLRPLPIQKPSPPLLRACLSENSIIEMAKSHRPILIAAQDNESIKHRLDIYEETLNSSGAPKEKIECLLNQVWVSKNLAISNDATPDIATVRERYFIEQNHFREARNKYNSSPEQSSPKSSDILGESDDFGSEFVYGTPGEVVSQIRLLEEIGVRNLMMKLNFADLGIEHVRKSLDVFAGEVMAYF